MRPFLYSNMFVLDGTGSSVIKFYVGPVEISILWRFWQIWLCYFPRLIRITGSRIKDAFSVESTRLKLKDCKYDCMENIFLQYLHLSWSMFYISWCVCWWIYFVGFKNNWCKDVYNIMKYFWVRINHMKLNSFNLIDKALLTMSISVLFNDNLDTLSLTLSPKNLVSTKVTRKNWVFHRFQQLFLQYRLWVWLW